MSEIMMGEDWVTQPLAGCGEAFVGGLMKADAVDRFRLW
jgi:hypothetical protein